MTALDRSVLTIQHFESGEIDPDHFGHEAHIYVAWLYVNRYDLAEAIRSFDGALRRLVQKLGAADKYHATITWFFLLLIAERSANDESWTLFRQRNSDIVTNSKRILAQYYSEQVLFSTRARKQFLLPDQLAECPSMLQATA